MKSMTAYAIVEKQTAKNTLSIEIKSYNSRYLDISIILPSFLNRLEAGLKHLVHKTISRGKIEVFVRYKEMEPQIKVEINEPMISAYDEAFSALAKKMGRKKEKLPMSFLLSLDSVLSNEKTIDFELAKESLEAALQEALELCVADKKREGAHLQKELLAQISLLEESVHIFEKNQKKMEAQLKQSIKERYAELVESSIPEDKLMSELALLLMKYTIQEEIVRLKSHIEILKKEMLENLQPGKRIDFICQEIQREVNTIGSKNQIIEISQSVVQAKEALENIREQAKNIE
jgi:uncharacterized protein (TIGR00255 family)